MHIDFQKYNPSRTPTWRFDRLTELLGRDPVQYPNPRRDDPLIRKAFRFLRLIRAAETEEAQVALFPKNPGLYYAYMIHQEEDPANRRYIETRLLAQQTDYEIAYTLATLPETITWYEALFYNIRDRINNRDWILRQVLGPAIERMLQDRAEELVQKMYAYFLGPYMYELVSDGFGERRLITREDDIATVMDEQIKQEVRVLTLTRVKTAEINRYNIIELLGAHQRTVEQALSAKDPSLVKTTVEENIQGMMDEIPWLVGNGMLTQAKLAETPLGKYEKYAAELRADEMLAIAADQEVPNVQKLAHKKLREPRHDAHGNAQQGS